MFFHVKFKKHSSDLFRRTKQNAENANFFTFDAQVATEDGLLADKRKIGREVCLPHQSLYIVQFVYCLL